MSAQSTFGQLLRCGLLATPLLLPRWVALERLPASVAWLVTDGSWLIVGAAVLGFLALATRTDEGTRFDFWEPLDQLLRGLPPGLGRGVLAALLLAAGAYWVPAHRWHAEEYSGDEPKYHRMALSLIRDLDVNMAGENLEPMSLSRFGHNLRFASLHTRDALVDLFEGEQRVPEGHVWNLGNWTLAGRHGGRYYVQAPGLPALLAPGLVAQHVFGGSWPPGLFVTAVLLALWSFGAVQSVRLASEVSDSPLAGGVAGLLFAFSAPVVLLDHHLYPEAGAMAALPWVMRRVRSGAPELRRMAVVSTAAVIGALPWLHVKYTAPAAVLLALIAIRLRYRRRALAAALVAAAVPFLLLLLFDHHVSGLFRPDAFYQRYGSDVYPGLGVFFSVGFLKGLATALFGARDGLLVMAPIAIAALIALPVALRREPVPVLEVTLVVASVWAAAATHDGGAPGPPGRLMAPAALLLATPLAVGLVELRPRPAFRWSLALLATIGIAISAHLLADWQRTVDPYRGAFATTAVDFSQHLPDSPAPAAGDEPGDRRLLEATKGLLLALLLGFWGVRLLATRGEVDPLGSAGAWRALRATHMAWWCSIILADVVLARLSG